MCIRDRQKCHDYGKASHGPVGDFGGDEASDESKNKDGNEHDNSVFHIQDVYKRQGYGGALSLVPDINYF